MWSVHMFIFFSPLQYNQRKVQLQPSDIWSGEQKAESQHLLCSFCSVMENKYFRKQVHLIKPRFSNFVTVSICKLFKKNFLKLPKI